MLNTVLDSLSFGQVSKHTRGLQNPTFKINALYHRQEVENRAFM
jgi:hypothetical protein